MKVNKTILFFSFLVCIVLTISASEDTFVAAGKSGYPFFDKEGKLGLILSDPQGGIASAKLLAPDALSISGRMLAGVGPVHSIQAVKNRMSEVWIIWEQKDFGRSHIFIGQLREGHLSASHSISSEFEGENFLPSLAVSLSNHLWAAWVNVHREKSYIVVKDISASRSWTLAVSRTFSLFTPKIQCDRDGAVWVFWVGQGIGLDEIFYSVFRNGEWTKPEIIASNPMVPHIHPSAGLDFLGNPWIAWSSYDGNDYEIYVASWDGRQWSGPEKVTENTYASDAQPSLGFFWNTVPVVVWTGSSGGKRDIFLSYKTDKYWVPPINISRDSQRNDSPVLVAEEDRLAVLWTDEEHIYIRQVSFFDLPMEADKKRVEMRETPVKGASILGKSWFTAFGDSITYGWITPPGDVKEKGYVLRLQILLKNNFVNPVVFNEGVPGEPTWEGVGRVVSAVTRNMAQYLLLMEGTNDVTQEYYSMGATAFNLRQMLLKSLQYEVFPLISTIIPRKGDRWTTTAQSRTYDLNDRIKKMAGDLKVMLVDNFESFSTYPPELGGWRSLIADFPDNLHPSEKGYQWMAETWHEKIKLIPFPPVKAKALKMRREGTIALTWEEDPKVTSASNLRYYAIYRKKESDPAFVLVGKVESSSSSFEDKNADVEKDWVYLLKSQNGEGIEGPVSDPVIPVIGDPYPPLNIKSETVLNRTLFHIEYINRVIWEDNPQNQGLFDVARFRIYRKQKGEGDDRYQWVGEVDASQKEFLDRNLPSRTAAGAYTYGVAAVDKNNVEGPLGKEEREGSYLSGTILLYRAT